MLNLYFIMFILEVSTVPKFQALPANFLCSARPGINILQNVYNGFIIFGGRGRQNLMKILLSTGIIFDLISVQLQTCGTSIQNIIFRIFFNLEKNLKNY